MFEHAYTSAYGCAPEPIKPFTVVERTRDNDGVGRRSDTLTRSRRYAIDRRDDLRRQGRPAFVEDASGRRVEVFRY